MDSTMSLFGTEFTLFGEDLLFSPAAPNDEGVVTASQDGLKSTTLSAASVWQIESSQGQDVLSPKQASRDLLEDWLDTRIDLLDLIGCQQDAEPSSESFMDLGFDLPIEDQTGLIALKIESEKTTRELSTIALEQPIVVAPQDLPTQSGDNVYDQGLGLLELLTSDVSQKQADVVSDLVGLDLAPAVEIAHLDTSASILSPMSPEDLETILSSGPTSPESLVAEESFESLLSSFSDMGDVSAVDEGKTTVDLALLTEMVSGNAAEVIPDSDRENHPTTTTAQSSQRGRSRKPKKPSVESPDDYLHRVQEKTTDRKQRKKQQNKDAATRYRQKKKLEQEIINQEVAALENRNTELKDKVDQMTREIRYLKSLLTDVYKARGGTSKSK